MQPNKLTASTLLICTCVIWGIQPMFAKFVVREMSPIPMVSIRYTIVALTLFAMLAWRGEKLLPPRRTWPALFTMGILGVCINNVTQFTGLQYSTVTNFTIIATLTPIVTALLSFVLIHERLHRLQWLGICSSLCGALYLISNGSLAAILTLSFNIGDVLFFTSQVAWALYSIIVVRIIDDVSPFAIVAWSGLLGSLTTAASAAYLGHFELAGKPLSYSAGLSASNLGRYSYTGKSGMLSPRVGIGGNAVWQTAEGQSLALTVDGGMYMKTDDTKQSAELSGGIAYTAFSNYTLRIGGHTGDKDDYAAAGFSIAMKWITLHATAKIPLRNNLDAVYMAGLAVNL